MIKRKALWFFYTLLYIGCILSFASCQGGNRSAASDEQGDTIPMKYARHLMMVKHDGYTEAIIANPWKEGAELHRYVLIPKGKKGDETAEMLMKRRAGISDNRKGAHVDFVRTPVESSVVFTSPHCQLMYELGCSQAIKGVCDLAYINITDVKRRAKAAKGSEGIVDCGSSMQPDVERIIDLKPAALLISPFENSGGYGKLDKLKIPIIETADYMETSPLGRAEWMKFYGALFLSEEGRGKTEETTFGGRGESQFNGFVNNKADSLFSAIEKEYLSLKTRAAKLPKGLSILTERKMGSVWYVPGGQSTMGILLKDANAKYIFASDKHSGSLALSPEQILDKGKEVDVWAFKYFGGKPMTRPDLLKEYDGYKELLAFMTQDIYECNTSVVPYFEQTSFHPEVLLREFILLAHPKAQGFGKLRFYQPLMGNDGLELWGRTVEC